MQKLDILVNLLKPKEFSKGALGVKSVISPVINLNDINEVSKDTIINSIVDKFSNNYPNIGIEKFDDEHLKTIPIVNEAYELNSSWEWIFGGTPKFHFDICFEDQGYSVVSKNGKVLQITPDLDGVIGLELRKDRALADKKHENFISLCLSEILA